MTQSEPFIKGRFNPTLIACGFFALFIFFAVLTARCLYADGSFYFLDLLVAGNFNEIFASRSFAGYLFEFPVVAGLYLGITGIPCLTILFGIGCFCAWPLAMFLCYRMAPQHFWLVMLACAAGYLNAAFMAVGEHIVAHAFFWPVLFAILFVRPLTPFAAASLLASSILLMRSYESLLFLGPVLIALLAWRIISERERPWQRTVLAGAAVFLIIAVYVAWIGVKYPNVLNPHGLSNFKQGIVTEIIHPGWTVGMSLIWAVLMLAAMYPPVAWFLKHPAAMISTILVVLVWGLYPVLDPRGLHPAIQYDCRFLDLVVPLALTPVAAVLSFRPQWLATRIPDLVRLSAMMLVAQSLWHLSATYQWDRYIGNWKNMLATKTGPILLAADTGFNDPELNAADPCLSLLIGPPGVRSIILPKKHYDHCVTMVIQRKRLFWWPFDPFNPQSFPDLIPYGFTYTDYFAFMDEAKPRNEVVAQVNAQKSIHE